MKRKFKVPHTLTLLSIIIVIMAILTWIVPSGQYDYVEDANKPTPIAGTYKPVDKVQVVDGIEVDSRQGIKDVLESPMKGTVQAAEVVVFVLLVGGAFGILGKTGAIEAGIAKIVKKLQGRDILIVPIAMLLFGFGGTIMGMAEETIPFYMIFIPLMLSLGYDSLTAVMIIFLGAQTGVAASTANPFSVGIAQASASIPISSGIGFRWVQFFICMVISIAFVMLYSRKIKRNPEKSTMYELDRVNKEHFLNSNEGGVTEFKWYHGVIIVAFIIGMIGMAYGVKELGWYISEISMIFLGIALFAGILGMFVGIMSEQDIAKSFVDGVKDICFAALVIGIARAILVVAQDGKIIDTILNSLATMLSGLPKTIFVTINLFIQAAIGFLIPSSSAHAALTMPLMAPLGDLVNIDRQVIVTAFQYGSALGHMVFPTFGILMAALGMAKIPFQKWVKVVWPLVLVLTVVSIVFLYVGLQIY